MNNLMSQDASLSQMPMDALGFSCQEQTQAFLKKLESDTRYCFELWRRAIQLGLDDAWHWLYETYARLVQHWISTKLFHYTQNDLEECINFAFSSMYQSLRKEDRFAGFSNLEQILKYLERCAYSAALRHNRTVTRIERLSALSTSSIATDDGGNPLLAVSTPVDIEAQVENAEAYTLAQANLQNEQERIVFTESFEMGAMPRQIYALYPDKFQDVREVSVVKQVLLERLRRLFKKEWQA